MQGKTSNLENVTARKAKVGEMVVGFSPFLVDEIGTMRESRSLQNKSLRK